MFESHIQKVIFVDEPFLTALEQDSIASYRSFQSTDIDTQIVTLPLQARDVGELAKRVHLSDVRAGSILVKPDYCDRFMTMDAFADSHAERKYRLWVLLCVALGAKKVSVTNLEEVSVESDDLNSLSGQVEASLPLAQGGVGFKMAKSMNHDESRKSIMSITAVATGGKPDLESADQILREHGLNRDDMFLRMYDMRRLTSNSVLRQEFSLDTSADVKRVFDSSLKAKVKLMSKLYGGSAEFEKVNKSFEKARTALKLTIAVEF